MRTVDVAERRARLARRHRIRPGDRAGSAEEAAAAMVCLHATDPATLVLSAVARAEGVTAEDVQRALHADRTLVKHLAMRRTLFAFPRGLMPLVHVGPSARVAGAEQRRVAKDVEKAGLHRDGERWLRRACAQAMEVLADGRARSMAEVRAEAPLLEGSITYGEGRAWGGQAPLGPRVLTVLSARGETVRAANDGAWTVSRPRWARMDRWLGPDWADGADQGAGEDPAAMAALVGAWLRAFGPGTEEDVRWWFGSTLTAVRRALRDVEAVQVDLGDTAGWLAPDDTDPVEPVDPWAALLPGLDPTTMGWKQRSWYLGDHAPDVFDGVGNAGPTAWWDGRIVGGWHQDPDGVVRLDLLEPVRPAGVRALEVEAERLTGWLDGLVLRWGFPSPLVRAATG